MPVIRPRLHKGLASWLLAAVFVAVQAIAFAHEIKHDLHQHDASCALHFYAEHLGKAPTSAVGFVAIVIPGESPVRSEAGDASTSASVSYQSRAPPVSSAVV